MLACMNEMFCNRSSFPTAAAPCSILLRCPAPAHNPDPTLWPAVVRTSSTRRELSRGWSLADSRRWSTPRPSWPRSSSAAPACCRCAGGPPSWRGCSGPSPVARRPSPVAAAPVPYALLSRALAHAGLRQVRHPDGLRLMRFAPRLSAGARAGERERRAVASGPSAARW